MLWVTGVVSTYCARVAFKKALTLSMKEDVEMGEGLVDEHEAAWAVLVAHQGHQQQQGFHHLLAA